MADLNPPSNSSCRDSNSTLERFEMLICFEFKFAQKQGDRKSVEMKRCLLIILGNLILGELR